MSFSCLFKESKPIRITIYMVLNAYRTTFIFIRTRRLVVTVVRYYNEQRRNYASSLMRPIR